MDMKAMTIVLRREELLLDRSPHSVQFEHLTEGLLCALSNAGAIPALTAAEIRLYAALALLHDVGKRAIPPEILNKPGWLTEEEYEVVKTHTTRGCALLEQIPELREHEAFPREQARDMIAAGACGAFAPAIVARFARNIGAICQAVYPPAG